MKSPDTDKVPEHILRAYLEGGRMWPQTRAGINLTIMKAICNPSNLDESFRSLAHSVFSANQLHTVRKLLISDHSEAEIVIPPVFPDSLFHNEWTKIRGAICKTFMMFFNIDFVSVKNNGREE